MIYTASITTDNATLKVSPKETELKVTQGLIFRFEIEFPPGCSGMQHVQIFDGSYQLYPSTPGESFHSDARVIGFDDLYLKSAAPFYFQILTWNLDDTWPHTVQVRIAMASLEDFQSRYMPSLVWGKITQNLDRIAKDQELMKQLAIKEFQAMTNNL